ncbi:MAG TPA: LysR family transcriptional regulator [Gammaproteobacteria bacterium]|nr:LysR family transcriptional regulator [Gammaproteobacteria bacterium]
MHVWNGVCEFVAVAETESFTKAAKQLRMSVAQVSRQVGGLEQRLKIKLFHRTTRKVALTESGTLYYELCRQVLDDLVEAQELTTHLHDKPSGKIRVSAPVTYGEEVIAPIITDFLIMYPDISIQLDLSNTCADLLGDGYDVAIRIGHLEDSRFIAKKIASRRRYVCASPDYLKKHGEPTTLKQLKKHPCLIGTADYWRFQNGGRVEHVNIEGRLRCNSGHGLVNAALKGIGLIQLPDYYVQSSIDAGELIPILSRYQEPDEGVWAVFPEKRYLPFKIKALIDFISQQLQ